MAKPPRGAYCPKCKSDNLKIRATTMGKGIYRRIRQTVYCGDCEHVIGVL